MTSLKFEVIQRLEPGGLLYVLGLASISVYPLSSIPQPWSPSSNMKGGWMGVQPGLRDSYVQNMLKLFK